MWTTPDPYQRLAFVDADNLENSAARPDGQGTTRISKVSNVMSQCFAVLAFNIIKFSSGNFIGFTTLLLAKLKAADSEIPMTKSDLSWFGSYCWTGPVGAIVIGLVAHLVGSKVTLVTGSLLFTLAWIIFYNAQSAASLLIAQAIVGINISIVLGPGVTYIVEITQANLRSTFMATTNLSMILGQFFTVLLSNWMSWRRITLVNLGFSVVGLVSMLLVPESPHWLASKGKYEKAERSLAWLRGWASPSDVQSEFQLLKESQEQANEQIAQSSSQERRLKDIFEPYLHKSFCLPLASIFLLFMMHSLAGSHTVQTYAMSVFKDIKSPLGEHVAGSIFDGLRIAGAVTCISTVHLLGRRKLMFFSLSVGALIYFMVALFIHLTSHKYLEAEIYQWMPTVMIIASTFVFAAGIDKVVNMLNGELFPSRFRNVGTGFGSFVGAVFSAIMSKMFLYMSDYLTIQGVFLFFAVMCVLSFVVLYNVIPETEGRTLVEIEEHYAHASGLKDCEIKKSSQDSNESRGVA